MNFDQALSTLTQFGAVSLTSLSLEWLFPAPAANPSPNDQWVELFAGLSEFILFLQITPAINNMFNKTNDANDVMSYFMMVFGWFMMKNGTVKVMRWYESLNMAGKHWITEPGSSCSTCPDSNGSTSGV